MNMQCPDVNCDVCSDAIMGRVWVRGDLMVCKECAHAINSNDPTAWPSVYHTFYLWPMAAWMGFMVTYIQMVPIFTIMCTALGAFFFILGAFKAIK